MEAHSARSSAAHGEKGKKVSGVPSERKPRVSSGGEGGTSRQVTMLGRQRDGQDRHRPGRRPRKLDHLGQPRQDHSTEGTQRQVTQVGDGSVGQQQTDLGPVRNATRRIYTTGIRGYQELWPDNGITVAGKTVGAKADCGQGPRHCSNAALDAVAQTGRWTDVPKVVAEECGQEKGGDSEAACSATLDHIQNTAEIAGGILGAAAATGATIHAVRRGRN